MSESLIKNPGADRFCVFPIVYDNLWSFYKKHLATFWVVEEVNISEDLSDWNNKLNDNERFFIKNVLAFFASSDGLVSENIVVNFYSEVQIPEVRQFYSVQMMIEAIHGEMYSLLIDTYITDPDEKHKLFNAVDNIPCIKKKADWAMKWMGTTNDNVPNETMDLIKSLRKLNIENIEHLDVLINERPKFNIRLLAFIIVEGIFFSGSFCAIYYMNNRGLLPGLSLSNIFIARDEALHTEFGVELYNTLNDRADQETVHSIFKEAVEIETEFIVHSLPCNLLGMNSQMMSEYIQYVADRWLKMLDYDTIYNTENPFSFMELISLNGKSNFFEKKVGGEYSRAGVGQSVEDRTITFDDDDDDF